MGNSTYWALHSEGNFLEIESFFTYFCSKLDQVLITWHLTISRKKIGPQCVLGVLCLELLFLSVGMLFSNIRIWELNCYKCEGRQLSHYNFF